ncbi:MAG: VOC family protein, partial [Phycisphaerae bacterium]|nr:VOC family protein [Phycisphaerae bacterium]
MGEPVVHWEIGAKDAAKMQEFYGSLFDWEIQNNFPGYAQVSTGQEDVCGGIMQIKDDVPPYVTFYVAVDDL